MNYLSLVQRIWACAVPQLLTCAYLFQVITLRRCANTQYIDKALHCPFPQTSDPHPIASLPFPQSEPTLLLKTLFFSYL